MQSAINHRGMSPIGSVTKFGDLEAIEVAVHSSCSTFTVPSSSKDIQVRSMAGGKVRGVFHEGHRYLQQNPSSKSMEAQRVREQGARIIWVIKDDGTYVGKIEDGMVYMKER